MNNYSYIFELVFLCEIFHFAYLFTIKNTMKKDTFLLISNSRQVGTSGLYSDLILTYLGICVMSQT